MSAFDLNFGNTPASSSTTDVFEAYKRQRSKDAALRATTALSQRPTFNPNEAARRINLTDSFRQETGMEFDPRYAGPDVEDRMQQVLDQRAVQRIAQENENAANFLADRGNAELAYDDLATVGFWAGAANSVGFGADATYDGARFMRGLDDLSTLERDLQLTDRVFADIYADAEAEGEDVDAMEQARKAVRERALEAVGVLPGQTAPEFIQRERGRILAEIGVEDLEREEAFPRSVGFDTINQRMSELPEAANFGEGLNNVWSIASRDPASFISWALQISAESIPGIAAGTLVSTTTRNPLAGAAVMGLASEARGRAGMFNELVQDGGYDITSSEGIQALLADPNALDLFQDQSAAYGAVIGVVDAVSGGLASQVLVNNPAGDFLLQMLAQAAMGSGGEALGRIAAGVPVDWTEVVIEGLVELTTAPLEIAGVGGKAQMNRIRRAGQAQERRAFFERISQTGEASELRKRSPRKYQELVEQVTRDGPVENVYVDPDKLDEMFQSGEVGTAEDFFAALPGMSLEAFEDARATGTDLKIPTAVYAAHIVGSQIEGRLSPHIKFGALEMSIAESQNLQREIKQSIEDTTKSIAQVREETDSLSTEVQAQYEELVSALQLAGRSPAVAAREALPMARFLETRAKRSGVPVSELAARYALPTVVARDAMPSQRTTQPRITEDAIYGAVTAEPGDATDTPNIAAVRKELQNMALEPTPENVRRAILSASGKGMLVGELDDDLLMRPEDITQPQGDELMQTVSLRDGTEDLSEWGLDVPGKTRELAVKLQKRQRKKYGKVRKDQRGPRTVQKLAQWMADEVIFEMQTPDKSARGWYGEKFQNALDIMGEVFPELVDQTRIDNRNRPIPGIETVEDARALMTTLLAITSNGAKVQDNYRIAMRLYREYRTEGALDLSDFKGNQRSSDMALKLERVMALRDETRPTWSDVRSYLMEELTVSEMNRERRAAGEKSVTGLPAGMLVPRSATILGPKLGAFYANLSGADGYLTMDLWWTRTINRYRGDLLPKVSGMRGDELTTTGEPKGLHRFKLLINRPDLTDQQALNYVTEHANRYRDRGYKNGTEAEKAANTIYKAAFVELDEQPGGAGDRAFMLDVARAAREVVRQRTGEVVSIADVQAMMWYYEKRLYAEMGVRDSGDISYEEAARRVIEIERNRAETEMFQTEPSPWRLPNLERMSPGPVPGVREVASKYMRENGMPVRHQVSYVTVDVDRATEIARLYDRMPDTPNDPEVRAAYEALAKETLAQYEALLELGFTFEFIEGEDPYASPREAILDMQENKHLWVFPTDEGFGTNTEANADHPLLQPSGITIDGKETVVNDIFRIVHDVFGHGSEGASFGPRGEENAWQAHVRMFSPLAARAMTTETRGQNSWVNYGPYGEQNRADPKNTVFADQKTGLLPEWVSTVGQADDAPTELFQLGRTALGRPAVTSLNDFKDFPMTSFEAENWFIVSPNTDLEPDRSAAMRERLDALGLQYEELRGMYMGEPDGVSFLVVGERWKGLMLGQEFGQESVLTNRGLEYTDGSGKATVPFNGVLRGAEAVAQTNHSIRLSDNEPFSLNLLWPEPMVDGLVDGKYYGIPLEEDGTLKLTHWSNGALDVLSPAKAGTGPLAGEERRRRQVKGVFFGLNIGGRGGYKKENLGSYRHEARLDPTTLYPFYQDPDNLRARIPANTPAPQQVGVYEELIREAGYKGYVVNEGPVGMVAKVYEDVTPERVVGESTYYQDGPLPTFKSALAEGIANAKQKDATPREWIAILNKMPGVKAAERWFTGVDAYLETAQEEDPKQRITRAQLYQWASANALTIEVDTSGKEFGSYVERPEPAESEYRVVKMIVPNLDRIGPNRDLVVDPFVYEGHFNDENIVVHARVTSRGGTLFVEEIQSDLNNVWRKSGDRMPRPGDNPFDVTAVEEQIASMEAELQTMKEAYAEQDKAWQAATLMNPEYRNMVNDVSEQLWNLWDAAEGREKEVIWEARSSFSRVMKHNMTLRRLASEGVMMLGARIELSDDPKVSAYDVARLALIRAMDASTALLNENMPDYLNTFLPVYEYINTQRANPRFDVGSAAEIAQLARGMQEMRDARVELVDRIDALEEQTARPRLDQPVTPFADASAIELATKQLMRMAAEEGYDKIAWTPAYMQGERWQQAVEQVNHQVTGVAWRPARNDAHDVTITLQDAPDSNPYSFDLLVAGGRVTEARSNRAGFLVGQQLSDLIGTDLAGRVATATTSGSVVPGEDGEALFINENQGAGFTTVYDRQIKKFIEKFAKKNGSSVTVDENLIPGVMKGTLSRNDMRRRVAALLDLPNTDTAARRERLENLVPEIEYRDRFPTAEDVLLAPQVTRTADDLRAGMRPTNIEIVLSQEKLAAENAEAGARLEAAFEAALLDPTTTLEHSRLRDVLDEARRDGTASVEEAREFTREIAIPRIEGEIDDARERARGWHDKANAETDAETRDAFFRYRDELTLRAELLAQDLERARAYADRLDRPEMERVYQLRTLLTDIRRLEREPMAALLPADERPTVEPRPVWSVEISDQMREAAMQPFVMFQSANRGPAGSIILPPPGDPGRAQINLFENANLSTVLHEGAHYYLWVLQSMADAGEATAQQEMVILRQWWERNAEGVAQDAGVGVDIVRRFLTDGTTGDTDLDRKVNVGLHEQFARGFEAYTMEGKAPSNALRAAFESFAAWLIERYKSIRGLRVNLDDEVRAVFDRLIATDEEIANAKAENNIDEEIATVAREMGLDENAYRRLVELSQEANDEAKQMALRDVMEPIFRERRAEIKAERAALTERITAEVMNKKHNRVLEWLGNGRWVGGDVPEEVAGLDLRMDTQMLREQYPDIDIAKLPRGRRPLYAKDTLVQADEVAGWFGYRAGDEMLQDLMTAPKARDEIKSRVDAEINAKYGDALTDGSLAQQAVDALHGEKRGQVIVAELRAINRVSSRKQSVTSRQQASAIARGMIAQMPTRDAIRQQDFLGAERRHAEQAARQLAAGDTEAAFQSKRKQLINHALYIESRKASEMVGKVERLAGRLRRRSTRQNLAGEYLEAIDSILDTYDFRRTSAREDQRRASLNAYIDMMKREGRDNEIAIPAHVLSQAKRVPYKTLTTQRLQGVYDALQNIEHTARMKQKLRDAKAERDLNAVVGKISRAFGRNVKGRPPQRFPSGISKAVDGVREYVNLTLNADTILRRIDGWTVGDAIEEIKRPVDEAAVQALQMRQKAAEDFENLYEPYSDVERTRMAIRRKIDGVPEPMSKWDIISVALNTGNKDNYERLTSIDSSQRFTPEQVQTMLDTLDSRDWEFVQSMWDYIGSYWPMIAEREKRTTGVTPKKVDAAMQVEAPPGVRGGYYPIVYDPRLNSMVADEQDMDLFQNMQAGRFGKAQTAAGHLEARANGGGGRTLQIGMQVPHLHVQQVIHDLAFSEPVNASWKIIRDGRVRALFEQNGMASDLRSLEVWLQDTATGQITTAGVLGRAARHMKAGFTVSKLALNMSTVAIQVTGVAQSVALIGPKYMAVGLSKYISGGMVPVGQRIKERSPFMAERETTFQRDLFDMLNQVSAGPQASAVARTRDLMMKIGFIAMQKVQFYAVDAPTWLGAYERALAEGKTDADAAYEADRMVARAQASGLFSDRASIERGSLTPTQRQNDFVRLFTALGSYMFAKLNIATEVVGRTDMRSPQSLFKMLIDLSLLFTVEAIAYAAIKGTLPGDDEDDPSWAAFLAGQTALTAVGTLPFVRDVAGPVQGFGGGGAYGGVIETMAIPAILATSADDEWTDAKTRDLIEFLGLMVPGIPSTAINRLIQVEQAGQEGEEVSPINYIMGLPR